MPFMIFDNSGTRRALDAKARRAAAAAGYALQKSKVRPGGYKVIERRRKVVVAGERFELSAEEVLQLIASLHLPVPHPRI